MDVPQKLKRQLLYDPDPTSGHISRKLNHNHKEILALTTNNSREEEWLKKIWCTHTMEQNPLAAHTVQNLLQCRRPGEIRVQSPSQEDPLEKGMSAHSRILPGEFHGQWSLAGNSPWGHKEPDTTEQLKYIHTHTHTHTHIQVYKAKSAVCDNIVQILRALLNEKVRQRKTNTK